MLLENTVKLAHFLPGPRARIPALIGVVLRKRGLDGEWIWRAAPATSMLPDVDLKALLAELLATCRALGLAIRDEPMKVPASRLAGGLVRLRGASVVIVDSTAPVVDRIAAVADALGELAVDPLHLSTEARRAIVLARNRRRRLRRLLRLRRNESVAAWKVTRLLRPTPGLRSATSARDPEQES